MAEREGWIREAVGSVVIEHVMLENAVRYALALLIGLPSGPYVVAGQSFAWLLEQTKSLADKHDLSDKTQRRLARAVDLAKEANGHRNRTAHDLWIPSVDEQDAYLRLRSVKGQMAMTEKRLTRQDVDETLQVIRDASTMFAMLIPALTVELLGAPQLGIDLDRFWAKFGL